MDSSNHNHTWPVFCILACLFVLAAAAPRAWQQVARHDTVDQMLQAYSLAGADRPAECPRVESRPVAAEAVVQAEPSPTPSTAVVPQTAVAEPDEGPSVPVLEIVVQPAGKIAGVATDVPAETAEPRVESEPHESVVQTPSVQTANPPAELPPVAAAADETPGANRSAAPVAEEFGPATPQPDSGTESSVAVVGPLLESPPLPLEEPAAPEAAAAPEPAAVAEDGSAAPEPAPSELISVSPSPAVEPLSAMPAQPAIQPQWQIPASLDTRLDELCVECETGEWALEAQSLLRRLCRALNQNSQTAERLFQQLKGLAAGTEKVAGRIKNETLATELRCAGFALARRVELWRRVVLSSRGSRQVPVDLPRLLESVEQYEACGSPAAGRQIAADWHHLRTYAEAQRHEKPRRLLPVALSTHPRPQAAGELADQLEGDYRNANFRLVISKDLVNRLIPEPPAEFDYVRDTIMGVAVRGRSVATSDVRVNFLPDAQRLRMVFEVEGTINSNTASSAGPATFFNDSQAAFVAQKELDFDGSGIHLADATVRAQSNTRLRGLRTLFDGVPLVGALAQTAARSQHAHATPQANRETSRKVSFRARQRIDAEAYTQLSEGVQRLQDKLFTPLEKLELRPEYISAQTTEEQMTIRVRLASEQQLAACTPRPREPEGCLASLQIHESLLNNLLVQLQLDGRSMALPELSRYLAGKLGSAPWETDPAHDDVRITFADQDALCVRCQDGQVVLQLTVAELRKGARAWSNFRVRVFYRPEVQGASAELVRDGVVHLIGRMSTGNQIAVRGIFAKVFPQNKPWRMTPARLLEDPKLADLTMRQFVIRDGWIGVALGVKEGE